MAELKMRSRKSLVMFAGAVGLSLLASACCLAASRDDVSGTREARPRDVPEAVAPDKLIFYDGFEYEVKRDERDERPGFIGPGRWSGVKSQNATGRGLGYLPAEKVGGYRCFRLPTTIGSFGERAKDNKDCWIYLDDFAMASSEGALPRYSR